MPDGTPTVRANPSSAAPHTAPPDDFHGPAGPDGAANFPAQGAASKPTNESSVPLTPGEHPPPDLNTIKGILPEPGKPGNRVEMITKMQQELIKAGYVLKGKNHGADGKFGESTQAAMADYLQRAGADHKLVDKIKDVNLKDHGTSYIRQNDVAIKALRDKDVGVKPDTSQTSGPDASTNTHPDHQKHHVTHGSPHHAVHHVPHGGAHIPAARLPSQP
jgi:hypothetical protein